MTIPILNLWWILVTETPSTLADVDRQLSTIRQTLARLRTGSPALSEQLGTRLIYLMQVRERLLNKKEQEHGPLVTQLR
jgi:hypothetical protein